MKSLPNAPDVKSWEAQNNRVVEQNFRQLEETLRSGYQPLDATLTALAGANWVANAIPVGSGADTVAQLVIGANQFPARASAGDVGAKTITDFGLSLVDDANAAAGRTTLGLGTAAVQNIGTSGANVPLLSTVNTWAAQQNLPSGSAAVPALTFGGTGATLYHEALTLPTRDNLYVFMNGAEAARFFNTAGVLGVNLASLTLTADLAIGDGGTGASTAADARTNLGCGTMATQNATAVAITGGTAALTGDLKCDGTFTAGDSFNDAHTINGSLTQRSGAGTVATFGRAGTDGAFIGLTDASGNFVYFGETAGLFEIQTPGSSYSTKLSITSAGLVTAHNGLAVTGAVSATGGLSGSTVAATSSILTSGAFAGIGYTAGAGGAVVQATDKATAVTLNKATGTITMHAAALAAGTTVSFTLNSLAVAATDQVVVTHHATGSFGSYSINGRATGAGTASISVRNITAADLSEAIVLRYSVIKSVDA